MEIEQIIPNRLYSVKYDGQEFAEYYRLFNREWTDVEFLTKFFSEHAEFTKNAFWKFLDNDPEMAAATVIEDANELEVYLKELSKNADENITPDLETYFKPLNGKYIYELKFIPMKGYGLKSMTFLRLYALRVEENCYLIVYGGIKLNDSIQNSPVLKDNVISKIDKVRSYLKREGISDKEDI